MKLILINGPTGIGKSTIALRLHQELPLSFLLDIDAQRRYISRYREQKKESLDLIYRLSVAMVENWLQSGHDVIIDKFMTDVIVTDRFLELGRKYSVDVFEFILTANKETLIARAAERGYREGSLLTPDKVPEFWDRIQKYIEERPEAIIVDTQNVGPEQTFAYVRERIFG